MKLELDMPADVLERVAERAAELVLERLEPAAASSPYLSVAEAAEYLRCSKQRVYDLLSSGRLAKLRDGTRVLVARSEVDSYLGRVAPLLPPSRRGRMERGRAA